MFKPTSLIGAYGYEGCTRDASVFHLRTFYFLGGLIGRLVRRPCVSGKEVGAQHPSDS